jgi:hypothetical protein
MAAAEYYSGACMECVPKYLLAPRPLQRAQTEQVVRRSDDHGIVQGRIMWLPGAENLPERAVRRAHGKGAVEDGIYNHPVVIVSRPADDEQTVHFHLVSWPLSARASIDFSQITSLQGRKLDQLYPKSNEFHTSRRSWYLPISPSPEHPDANSKKAKKRFPTLAIADGASLRWDSYVNIRHVYKIDWTLLKPYSNLNTPRTTTFRLERESTVRMVAKGKVLTLYEPSEQVPTPELHTSRTAPSCLSTSTDSTSSIDRSRSGLDSPDSDDERTPSRRTPTSPTASRAPTAFSLGLRKDSGNAERSPGSSLGESPDPGSKRSFLARVLDRLFQRRQRG